MTRALTYRGELRCFTFESHPEAHGKQDLHLVAPAAGAARGTVVETERGLRCSVCNGRVVTDAAERIAA